MQKDEKHVFFTRTTGGYLTVHARVYIRRKGANLWQLFIVRVGLMSGGLVVRILALSLPGPAFHPKPCGGGAVGAGEHFDCSSSFYFSSFSFHINNKLLIFAPKLNISTFFSSVNDV